MFPKISMVKKAIESLYDATATVYKLTEVTKDSITTEERAIQTSSLRCRVSYKNIGAAQSTDTIDTQHQEIKLYFDADDAVIEAGSIIDVLWDDGREATFKNASIPQVYNHHAELTLLLNEDKP